VGNLLPPSSLLQKEIGIYLPKYLASLNRNMTLKPYLESKISVLGLKVRRPPSTKCITCCNDTKLCIAPRGVFTVNVPFDSRGKQEVCPDGH